MERWRLPAAGAMAVGLFLLIQLGALALVEPFMAADYQAVEDPGDPTNSLVYVVAIFAATALMLAAIRYEVTWAIRAGIVFASALITWYVLRVVVPPVLTVGGANVLAAVGALAVGAALVVHPEWYVIDAAGVVMGAGAAGIFGITFGLLPAILLLVVLAVYDAVSVYGTEHMLTLAEGVMELNVPVVLVVPVTLSYSFRDAGSPESMSDETDAEPTSDGNGSESTADRGDSATPEDGDAFERDALFIGLGDAVIPAVLIASAAFFLADAVPSLGVPGVALNLPALSAMVGSLLGLVALLWLVAKGRPHAGLPLLNGGAIGGYLLGALASGLTLAQALGL